MSGVAGTDAGPRRNRGLLIALTVVAAAILVALVVVILLLLPRGSTTLAGATSTPTASASPSPTPTVAATRTHAPGTTTPTPTSSSSSSGTSGGSDTPALSLDFSTSTPTVYCNTQAPAGQPPLALSFVWTSTGATDVYFGVATSDAQAGALYSELPAKGSSADFPYEVDFPCPQASQQYAMTVVDASGDKVNRSVTIVNGGDTQ